MAGDDIVVLGRLADPYGMQGWLRLYAFADDPLAWGRMPVWWVGKEGGPWRQCGLKSLKVHGEGLVVLLDGVPDRTAAEAMKGFLVGAPRSGLPAYLRCREPVAGRLSGCPGSVSPVCPRAVRASSS